MEITRLHATCVAIGKHGVLLTGESGAGKSDLALRLIDRGAHLVADDQVEITYIKSILSVKAPERIQGLLEIRGLGIFTVPFHKKATIALVVRLSKQEWIERLPHPETCSLLGVDVPQIRLCGFEVSAPIKIEKTVAALNDGSMKVGALRE